MGSGAGGGPVPALVGGVYPIFVGEAGLSISRDRDRARL